MFAEIGRRGSLSTTDATTGRRDGPVAAELRLAHRVTGRDPLFGSSFALAAEPCGRASGSGRLSIWGRGAVTRFAGAEGDLSVDGEVATGMLGADWAQGRLEERAAGLAQPGRGRLPRRERGHGGSTLTGLYPWSRYALSERLYGVGGAGYGEDSLTVQLDEEAAIRTDLGLWMAAVGLRGVVVDGGADGLTLAVGPDALMVRTGTEAVLAGGGKLAAAEGDVSRLRLGLERSRRFRLAEDATLTPSVEVGVRHDDGHAETGSGADIGGGLAWRDSGRGIMADFRGRVLLVHEAAGFRERGLSGTLAWDPEPASDRGPSVSLTETVGASASGGLDALLSRDTLSLLAVDGNGDEPRRRRLEARFGYGFAAFGDRFTSLPEVRLGTSQASRESTAGWRLALARRGELAFEVGVYATRRQLAHGDGGPREKSAPR